MLKAMMTNSMLALSFWGYLVLACLAVYAVIGTVVLLLWMTTRRTRYLKVGVVLVSMSGLLLALVMYLSKHLR